MNRTEFAKYHIELFEQTKSLPKRASIQNAEGFESVGNIGVNRVSVKKVFLKIWRLALLVFITFVTTASLWPGNISLSTW